MSRVDKTYQSSNSSNHLASKSSTIYCPICHKIIKESMLEQLKQMKVLPFCSQRCKLVDLGAWLDGNYRLEVQSDSKESQTSA